MEIVVLGGATATEDNSGCVQAGAVTDGGPRPRRVGGPRGSTKRPRQSHQQKAYREVEPRNTATDGWIIKT